MQSEPNARAEFLRSLKPGDRILVSAPEELSQPPRAYPPAEAVFVSCADCPETALVCVVVCGLPDGWAEEPNEPLGLRVLWQEQVIERLDEDQRVARLRQQLRAMAEVA